MAVPEKGPVGGVSGGPVGARRQVEGTRQAAHVGHLGVGMEV